MLPIINILPLASQISGPPYVLPCISSIKFKYLFVIEHMCWPSVEWYFFFWTSLAIFIFPLYTDFTKVLNLAWGLILWLWLGFDWFDIKNIIDAICQWQSLTLICFSSYSQSHIVRFKALALLLLALLCIYNLFI